MGRMMQPEPPTEEMLAQALHEIGKEWGFTELEVNSDQIAAYLVLKIGPPARPPRERRRSAYSTSSSARG